MRNTLLGSCLLALSLGLVGCDNTSKDDKVVPESPPVTAPGGETKGGAMEGPATKPGGGAESPAPTTPPAEPATPPEKKEEMPK